MNTIKLTQPIIAGIIIIIAFFLNWVTVYIVSFSAFELSSMLLNESRRPESYSSYLLSYILYLLPICSGYIVYCELKKIVRFKKIVSVILLIIMVLICYRLFPHYGSVDNARLGIGFYLTLGGTIYMNYLILIGPKFQKSISVENEVIKAGTSLSSINNLKTDIEQIEKLYTLKEKGVLSEEEYLEQKKRLLNKSEVDKVVSEKEPIDNPINISNTDPLLSVADNELSIENVTEKKELATPLKKMFDLSASQAEISKEQNRIIVANQIENKKKSAQRNRIILISLCVLAILSLGTFITLKYFIKNSYQKAVSYISESNFQEAKRYVNEAYTEIANNGLDLTLEQKENLDLIRDMVISMQKFDDFKQKYSNTPPPVLSTNNETYVKEGNLLLEKRNYFVEIPLVDIKDKRGVGFDVKKVMAPLIDYWDSLHIDLAVYIMNDSILLATQSNKINRTIDGYVITKEIVDMVINNIANREKNSDKINALQTKLKNALIAINENIKKQEGLITESGVDVFLVGGQIPFNVNNYVIKEEIEYGEEASESPIYIVFQNGQKIFSIGPIYDNNSQQYIDKIGQITIFSSKFKTSEGIGVNSSIKDFISKYPDFRIWYTYISDMYVINTKQYNKLQFVLDGKDFIGIIPKIDGDMNLLKLSDFKEDAKINEIRVLGN